MTTPAIVPAYSFTARNARVKEEMRAAFDEFYESEHYVLGAKTRAFEKAFARFCQTRHAVGVSNGLDALHLALLALGVGEGDEVIVPSNTYIATVLAVSYVGATPIFVEPRLGSYNLDPTRIESALTARTKAIMVTHLYGQACEMAAVMDIARRRGLYVVEDNAQAQGATYDGKVTGSFGDVNATSFYPTKNVGALGEAGAITTDSETHAAAIRTLRNYGSSQRYHNDRVGYNRRIDELQAAFLLVILEHVGHWTEERRAIAARYTEQLADLDPALALPVVAEGCAPVWHQYVVRVGERDGLRARLRDVGVGTQIHYPIPPHLQACYAELGFGPGDFPIAEQISRECLSLPMYPGLTAEQVDRVCAAIRAKL